MVQTTTNRLHTAILVVLTLSVLALAYLANQQQTQIGVHAALLDSAEKQLGTLGVTLDAQTKAHKELAAKTVIDISDLRTQSKSAINLASRVEKVEKSFDETKAIVSSANKDIATQVAVLRVSIQQALSVKLDSSGAVVERSRQKKNGIDFK
jgi:uncharacterized protein YlxW (UPF0749 family)